MRSPPPMGIGGTMSPPPMGIGLLDDPLSEELPDALMLG